MSWERLPVFDRLWHALDREQGGRSWRGDVWVPAPIALLALKRLLGEDSTRSALDPWATNGILLSFAIESSVAGKGVGVLRSATDRELAREIAGELPIDWIEVPGWGEAVALGLVQPGLIDGEKQQRFDVVISMPPWGYRLQDRGLPDPLKRDPAREVLVAAWDRLSDSGVGAAIVQRNFLLADRGTIFNRLAAAGLFVDSFVELPAGTFAPSTQLGGAIVLVRRGKARPIFCARLTGDTVRDGHIFENAQDRVDSPTDVALGFLVAPKVYRGLDPEIAEQTLLRLTGATKWPRIELGELLRGLDMGRSSKVFEPKESAVYVPLIGRSPAHTRLEDLTLKPQNYAQIQVDSERVDPEWLTGYLSAPTGLQARGTALCPGFIPRITKESLPTIPVLLPPIAEQRAASEAARGIRIMREQLSQLGREVWTDPATAGRFRALVPVKTEEEAFREWLEQLPFPLASILWTYHAAGKDHKARYEHLLHFFEAVAEFHALILLSAAARDGAMREQFLPEVHAALAKSNLSFDRATFATWRTAIDVLGKRFRVLREDRKDGGRERIENVLRTSDDTVLDLLFGKSLPPILQRANKFRNDWGHGGVVGTAEARRLSEVLGGELLAYREATSDAWSRFELVLAGPMRLQNRAFLTMVDRAIGVATPFEKKEVVLSVPIEEGRLHLVAKGRTDALELLPLVRLMPSPKTAANACYFYDKMKDKQTRFVSYHFEHDAEVVDTFPDVAEALRLIGASLAGGGVGGPADQGRA
jgi:hypothetical protein